MGCFKKYQGTTYYNLALSTQPKDKVHISQKYCAGGLIKRIIILRGL
jgi:hypothetical protein